jgi:hypothetical protein
MTKRHHSHGHRTGNALHARKQVAPHFNDTAERAKSGFLKKHGKPGARRKQGK